MYSVANTTVSILRGAGSDALGDSDDSNQIIAYSGIIAQILETGHFTYGSTSHTPATLRAISCYLPSRTDVVETDRILDERSGRIFEIKSVTDEGRLGVDSDLYLELVRVTQTEHL